MLTKADTPFLLYVPQHTS